MIMVPPLTGGAVMFVMVGGVYEKWALWVWPSVVPSATIPSMVTLTGRFSPVDGRDVALIWFEARISSGDVHVLPFMTIFLVVAPVNRGFGSI